MTNHSCVPWNGQGTGGGNTFAYYVDQVVGFGRVPPAALRVMPTKQAVQLFRTSALRLARAAKPPLSPEQIAEHVDAAEETLTYVAGRYLFQGARCCGRS